MSGVNQSVVYSVARIRCMFNNSTTGLTETFRDTGFWVGQGARRAFVTNRHTLDKSFSSERREDLELAGIEIELRHLEGDIAYNETGFFAVNNFQSCYHLHPTADCAVLIDPEFDCPREFADHVPLSLDTIADGEFLRGKAQLMDFVSFIGFPGHDDDPWWDQQANIPIARMASIASTPERSFVNSAIRTADVVLVSGLSFSGSSGSPVFLHRKGIRATPPLVADFVPATLIGIMSGHSMEAGPLPEMLRHTGLSYLTRSTSILELLEACGGPLTSWQ